MGEVINTSAAMSKVNQVLSSASVKARLEKALEAAMPLEKFVVSVETMIRRNPDLLTVAVEDPGSIIGCAIRCAHFGLNPDPMARQVAFVPRRNKNTRRLEANLVIQYGGWITMGRANGALETLRANVVWPGDVFEFDEGTEYFIRHRRGLGKHHSPDDYVAAYAIAELPGGARQFAVLDRWELDQVEEFARGSGGAVWKGAWKPRMAAKSAIHRLIKQLPAGGRMATAVSLDEAAMIGKAQGLGELVQTGQEPQRTPMDELAEELGVVPFHPEEEELAAGDEPDEEKPKPPPPAPKAKKTRRPKKQAPATQKAPPAPQAPKGPPGEQGSLMGSQGFKEKDLPF